MVEIQNLWRLTLPKNTPLQGWQTEVSKLFNTTCLPCASKWWLKKKQKRCSVYCKIWKPSRLPPTSFGVSWGAIKFFFKCFLCYFILAFIGRKGSSTMFCPFTYTKSTNNRSMAQVRLFSFLTTGKQKLNKKKGSK